MKHISILIPAILCFLQCRFDGNMYNPEDPAYVPPSFALDISASNVKHGDTVLTDTLCIVLTGNDEKHHHNLFRYSLDGSPWSEWMGDSEKEYRIKHTGISEGTHALKIEYCYHPGWIDTHDSTISFFRAIKPKIAAMNDTLLDADAGTCCTLWVKAEGTGELTYEWYCDSEKMVSVSKDSLILDTISVEDTAFRWHCRVLSNWGDDSSAAIRLRVLFRVFFDGNGSTGGIVPKDTNRYASRSIARVPGNPGNLTRRGYAFNEWNTEKEGNGNDRDSGDIFEIGTESVTLYAQWYPNDSFTVSYDGNGADSGEVPETKRYYKTGELVMATGNSGNLRREGYTFTGWNTQANDSGTEYVENDTFTMEEKNITLYAQWTDNPTWEVTYDANGAEGGEVPVDAKMYEEGETVIVAGNSGNLNKAGNTFTGWNTEAEGENGAAYTPGASFIMGKEDITLYARWTTRPVYTLTYTGNGNTSGSPPAQIENEAGVEIKIAGSGNLIRKGHSFIAWDTEADTSGNEYKENDPYTMSEIHDTLYAQWEISKFTVSYHSNGDNVKDVPQSTNHLYNSEITLDSKVPSRIGYTFFRWNTAAGGDGVDYKPGDMFTIGDMNVTFYAKWNVNEYTITYNGNGNDEGDTPDTITQDYNDSITIAGSGNLIKIGYSFTGWNTRADGNGTPYAANTIIPMGMNDITLYAQWKINRYKVTFDTRGATPATIDTTVDYNSLIAAPAVPVKTGYTFDKWCKDSAETTSWEFANDKVTESLTIYAKWTISCYKITFNSQGGSPADSQMVNYNDTAKTPTAPTKTGYIFGGWYKEAGCTNKWTFGTDKIYDNVTLYAKWTAITYTITYHLNGGTNGKNPATYTIEFFEIVLADAERKSYVFDGWYSDSGFTTKVKMKIIPKGSTGNRELWAKWVITDADANLYTEVKIGDQVWMVENLMTTKYNNGIGIPKVAADNAWGNLSSPGYCWYNNDSASYARIYGALYNLYTVHTENLAPVGWHVSTHEDWEVLIDYLEKNGYNWDGTTSGNKIAKSLASKTGWRVCEKVGAVGCFYKDLVNNSSGFSAVSAGLREVDGTFTGMGDMGRWWHPGADGTGWGVSNFLSYDNEMLLNSWDDPVRGFSIRCVRDQ